MHEATLPAPSTRERVLALLRRYGWNATSFQVLEPHFRYWFDADDAVVAYVDTGRAWVAAGRPVCAPARLKEVADRFVEAAHHSGRRVCFFASDHRFDEASGYPALRVGEQPVWDPRTWDAVLAASPSVRAQLNRARAKGVRVRLARAEEVEGERPGVRAQMEALIAKWLGLRPMPPMGFLVEVHPFEHAAERRYLLAERDERLVGVLVAVPIYARGGWLFEDLLRDPAAPNGTMELLVDAAMRAVAAEGATLATLGLVALAGPVSGWLRLARRVAVGLYDFRGLRAFRAKLRPVAWEPVSLAFPPGRRGTVALFDALAAFSSEGLLRFGLSTLARGPSVVVQVLAVLLLPWTALLAGADTAHWFPATWVKWAWVAFDAGLVVGLLALARRWRRGLSTWLAALITADAGLTLAQAFLFNLPRAMSVWERAVVVIATLAPTFAATLLWRARAHRLEALRGYSSSR